MARKRKTPPRYKSGPMKGKFKPRKKARKTTALVTTTRTTTMARRRRRRGGSRSRSRSRRGAAPGKSFTKQAQELMMGGAMYGFITEGAGGSTEVITQNLAKVPTLGNRDITNGVVLYFADKYLTKSKYVKAMAMAALVTGATKFGQSGFSLSGESIRGFDDALDVDAISGELDEDGL